MRAFFSVLLVLLALAVVVPCAHAGELVPSRYSTVNPSADGIGKMYLGREIAKVMTYHGADWLERAERAREERPDMVIGALALKPGIAVADIMLQAIVRALKPGGRLVFVEFRGDDATVPIKRLHTMTETQVRKETDSFALEWMKTVRDLPWQHVIVFRKVAAQSR